MKISIEKIGSKIIRVTLIADIQFSENLSSLAHCEGAYKTSYAAADSATPAASDRTESHEFLTVEETAKILQVGRDKVYYLIRTGQLRSIKIGKLRRISQAWIGEFVDSSTFP